MATYLLWGAPSQGKSYISTLFAVNAMLDKKKVFTNYPIIYYKPLNIIQRIKNIYRNYKKLPSIEQEVYSSYKWERNYIYAGLNNVTILLDEAYTEFNCHDKLKIDEHTFFATTGHNNNDVYLIAQNYSRINVAIRELANFFIFVRKYSNPFSLLSKHGRQQLTPLVFIVESYISEDDFKYRRINKHAIYDYRRYFFDLKIAKAYDTQYFKSLEKPLQPVKWIDAIKKPYVIDPEKEEEKMKNEFTFD